MPGKRPDGSCIHRLILERAEEAKEPGVIMGDCKRCGARIRHEPFALMDELGWAGKKPISLKPSHRKPI